MKTKNQNTKAKQNTNSGLLSSPEPLTTNLLPKIDFKRRWQNRRLDTNKLLALLKAEAPSFFALAEVVGKWIFIRFDSKQPVEVTRELSELGFHWNNTRQIWQHTGGTLAPKPADYDPRKRYGSYFPAKAA